ncbi:MAG: HAMP domain-containing sensor histidine kinase [Taibaiella sp.]|jgi:signal transduction histidine kinase
MYRKPFYYFTLLSGFLYLLLTGHQVQAGNVDSSAYHIDHYSNENGLPQNSVKAIAKDEYGFIWLATEAGLCRFDGQHFSLFNKFNTGILSSRIVDIWRSPTNNQLYAITERWSMLGIKNGTVTSELKKWVSAFTLSSNVLQPSWKYKHWKDTYRLDSLQLTLTDNQIILLKRNGIVLWFKQGKFMAKQELHTPKKFNSFFTIDSSLYMLDKSPAINNVMEITPWGMVTVSLKGDILKQNQPGDRFLCINQSSGQLFIYSNKCFYLVNKLYDGNLNTRLLLEGFDFEQMKISAGFYDTASQRIFLGSQINGLFVFTHKIFTPKTYKRDSGWDNIFYDLTPYSDSSVLTGKGILFYSGSDRAQIFPKINVNSSIIGRMLYRSVDSTIWTADWDYVYRLTEDGKDVISKWKMKAVSAITRISSSGEIWLGTNKNGLYAIHPQKPDNPPRLVLANTDYIGCLQQQKNTNIIWIGTDNRLFRCHLPDMKLDTIKQLDHKVVRGIHISDTNEVWLCTYEDGLYLYRDHKVTKFPTDRNKFLNTVHYITEDKKGFFWITTNNGVFQVYKQALLQYVQHKDRVPYYYHYSKNSGLNTNEFNGGGQQVGAKLKNGYVAFASMDGVVFFKPDEVQAELSNGPILIDQLELDGKRIITVDTIILDHDFTNLKFRVTTAYFGNPDNIQFEYKLDNTHWAILENETFAFNTLAAGKHTLVIRKRSGFDNRYNYKKIMIQVRPAFYETGVFRFGCLLLLFVLIWLFLQLRLGFLNRRNKYLEQVVADRTSDLKGIINALEMSERKLGDELLFQEKLNKNIVHDIRTPLKYLVLFSKYMFQKVKKSEVPSVDEVEGIYFSSERIYNYTDKLTSYLKARMEKTQSKSKVNLYEVVGQNEAIFLLALREKNNTIINDLPRDLTIVTYHQIFDILMHNLIDNAIKNTHNGTIHISSTHDDHGNLIVRIRDTGKGMTVHEADIYNKYLTGKGDDESEQYTGFGFSTIKEILPLLNIDIVVDASKESGVCFELHFKE